MLMSRYRPFGMGLTFRASEMRLRRLQQSSLAYSSDGETVSLLSHPLGASKVLFSAIIRFV